MERIRGKTYATRTEARVYFSDYIEVIYNRTRWRSCLSRMSPAEYEAISMVIGEHILWDREGEGCKLPDDVTLACYIVTLFETVVIATIQDLSCNQSGAEIWCRPLLILASQVDSGGPVHARPYYSNDNNCCIREICKALMTGRR
jgi:hypothetical protein